MARQTRPAFLSPWTEVASANVRTFSPSEVITHVAGNSALGLRIDGDDASATARCILGPLNDTPIPDDVKAQATMYAPQLVATMRGNVRRIARHMTAGSLDTSKLVRLARPNSPAQFERDAAVAFRSRTSRPIETPLKIAIVADMNWTIRRNNPTYMPMVGTLAFILSDAAACAGLQAGAYGVRGRYRSIGGAPPASRPNPDKPVALATVICPYGRRIVPQDFAAHTSHSGYIWAAGVALGGPVGYSDGGTGGIDLARERDGATFVVALGQFGDVSKADVTLAPNTSVDNAVKAVHAALQARQHKAAA